MSEFQAKLIFELLKFSWVRNIVLRQIERKLSDMKGERPMENQLTPNVNVPYFETMAFSIAGLAYSQYLRGLVIEKIDDPSHEWDDRVLAMFDAIFGYTK